MILNCLDLLIDDLHVRGIELNVSKKNCTRKLYSAEEAVKILNLKILVGHNLSLTNKETIYSI